LYFSLRDSYFDAKELDRWAEYLASDKSIIDTPRNMICLSPLLHRWSSKAIFGLEPIRPEAENSVFVRFRWLPFTGFSIKNTRHDLSRTPDEARTVRPGLQAYEVVNLVTKRPIQTGDVFEIKSNEKGQLPSWTLLELQWKLIGMCAISGAGEAEAEDFDDSDDEEEE
jgi:hypothetical protein